MAAKTDLSDKIKELQSNGRNMLSLNCAIVTGKLIQLNLDKDAQWFDQNNCSRQSFQNNIIFKFQGSIKPKDSSNGLSQKFHPYNPAIDRGFKSNIKSVNKAENFVHNPNSSISKQVISKNDMYEDINDVTMTECSSSKLVSSHAQPEFIRYDDAEKEIVMIKNQIETLEGMQKACGSIEDLVEPLLGVIKANEKAIKKLKEKITLILAQEVAKSEKLAQKERQRIQEEEEKNTSVIVKIKKDFDKVNESLSELKKSNIERTQYLEEVLNNISDKIANIAITENDTSKNSELSAQNAALMAKNSQLEYTISELKSKLEGTRSEILLKDKIHEGCSTKIMSLEEKLRDSKKDVKLFMEKMETETQVDKMKLSLLAKPDCEKEKLTNIICQQNVALHQIRDEDSLEGIKNSKTINEQASYILLLKDEIKNKQSISDIRASEILISTENYSKLNEQYETLKKRVEGPTFEFFVNKASNFEVINTVYTTCADMEKVSLDNKLTTDIIGDKLCIIIGKLDHGLLQDKGALIKNIKEVCPQYIDVLKKGQKGAKKK